MIEAPLNGEGDADVKATSGEGDADVYSPSAESLQADSLFSKDLESTCSELPERHSLLWYKENT